MGLGSEGYIILTSWEMSLGILASLYNVIGVLHSVFFSE